MSDPDLNTNRLEFRGRPADGVHALEHHDGATIVKVLAEHPSGPQDELARKAAPICPVGAIALED